MDSPEKQDSTATSRAPSSQCPQLPVPGKGGEGPGLVPRELDLACPN